MSRAEFVRFGGLVGLVFLWSHGNRLWHSSPAAGIGVAVLLFLGMLAIGLIGPLTRGRAAKNTDESHRNTGILLVGILLAGIAGIATFAIALAIELLWQQTAEGSRPVVAACWHGVSVGSIALLALGDRPSE